MSLLKPEERVRLLMNLLSDPDDWISREILMLANEIDNEPPTGVNDSQPEAVSFQKQ